MKIVCDNSRFVDTGQQIGYLSQLLGFIQIYLDIRPIIRTFADNLEKDINKRKIKYGQTTEQIHLGRIPVIYHH